MRRILTIGLIALLFVGAVVFACFDSDPDSLLGNDMSIVTGKHGSYLEIPHFTWPDREKWLEQWKAWKTEQEKMTTIKPADALQTAFPFTLNISFSGFLDDRGQQVTEEIVRLTLFYYSKSGEWMILKDIKDPAYEIVSEGGKSRALFGRHTIPTPMGYNEGEYIPVVFYFQTKSGNYNSFSLNDFLDKRKNLGAPNYAEGANVLAIIVCDNSKPY